MISPLGLNVEDSWNNLLQNKSGIVNIKDINEYKNDANYPDCYMGLIP